MEYRLGRSELRVSVVGLGTLLLSPVPSSARRRSSTHQGRLTCRGLLWGRHNGGVEWTSRWMSTSNLAQRQRSLT